MKLLNNNSINYKDRQRDMYDFDKLSTLDDVKIIIAKFINSGYTIDNITVREMDDYENGPTVLGYDLKEIDKIEEDFKDMEIESYTIGGHREEQNFFAMIAPSQNRLIVDYSPRNKSEIMSMISELENQENLNKTNSNNFQK